MNLMKQAVIIAAQAFIAPLDMFYELLTSSNMIGVYWSVFLFVVVYRLLIVPLVGSRMGSGSSDKSRRKRNGTGSED